MEDFLTLISRSFDNNQFINSYVFDLILSKKGLPDIWKNVIIDLFTISQNLRDLTKCGSVTNK